MDYSKCDLLCAGFCALGVLSGLSGFVAFLFVFGNVQAGIWAFFSGFYALASLFLFGLKMSGVLDEWYGESQLFRISMLGLAGALASFVATVCYIAVVVSIHENFPTMASMSHNHFIMMVWSILTVKWSLTTTMVARRHSRRLRSGYQPL